MSAADDPDGPTLWAGRLRRWPGEVPGDAPEDVSGDAGPGDRTAISRRAAARDDTVLAAGPRPAGDDTVLAPRPASGERDAHGGEDDATLMARGPRATHAPADATRSHPATRREASARPAPAGHAGRARIPGGDRESYPPRVAEPVIAVRSAAAPVSGLREGEEAPASPRRAPRARRAALVWAAVGLAVLAAAACGGILLLVT